MIPSQTQIVRIAFVSLYVRAGVHIREYIRKIVKRVFAKQREKALLKDSKDILMISKTYKFMIR